jgi:hypothetical protein
MTNMFPTKERNYSSAGALKKKLQQAEMMYVLKIVAKYHTHITENM